MFERAIVTRLILVPLSLQVACAGGGESCAVCRDEKCADLVALCVDDEACACMSSCVGRTGIPGVEGCLGSCGLAQRPPDFDPLEECIAIACPDSGDECASGGRYTPPDAPDATDASDAGDVGEIRGGGELADCGFDPTLRFDPSGTTLQLQSADAAVCVRLERRDEGAGSLANTQWLLLAMRVGPRGEVAQVEDPSALCWYSSHHNFLDWAHAWTGRTHHDLELEWDGHDARKYTLHTFAQGPLGAACAPLADGSEPLGAPVVLLPFEP